MEMKAGKKSTTPLGTSRNRSHDPRTRAETRPNSGLNNGTDLLRSRVRGGHFPGATKVMRNLRMGSWNIGTMTGRSLEIEDMMRRRHLDVLCVQELGWKNTADRARFLDTRTKAYKMTTTERSKVRTESVSS